MTSEKLLGDGGYILTIIDDDPEDLHNVIWEIRERLRKTYGLRVVE